MVDRKAKPVMVHHVRKPLEKLSAQEVEAIIDKKVRSIVKAKLDGGDPAKVFKERGNHPYMKAKDGRIIPIHKVRIHESGHPIEVGAGSKSRYVAPGSNHHMEIVAVLDENGTEKKWEGPVVPTFEANQRFRNHEPIIKRDHGPNRRFKFSLAGGEYVEMEDQSGVLRLYRVKFISEGEVEIRLHCDARPDTLLKKTGGRSGLRPSPDKLRKSKARKVTVDPLGNIFPAND